MRAGSMLERDGLHVWAELLPDGKLAIQGQDLGSGPFGTREYEYAISVPLADIPTVVKALGGRMELTCSSCSW
jgi:hypothetical protein